MASLPVYLSQGFISVYGNGNLWNIVGANTATNPRFGIIDQSNYGSASLAIGDTVMFNEKDVTAPVSYNGDTFYILPGDKVISVLYVYNITPPA